MGSAAEETVDPGDAGAAILFKRISKEQTRQMSIHPDLGTDDREAAIERLQESGTSARETKTEETGDLPR